jgi:hypothetical protein
MDIHEIPNITEILDAETAKRIKSWPHPTNRASEAGHPCVRFLVLSRTSNELKALHDVGLQRIFDLGNLFEEYLLRQMAASGKLNVVEQQRAFEWPKFQLTGSVDGLLSVNGDRIPLEIKSSSPNVFRAVVDMAPVDMLKSKYSWIRKYPAQILLYMLMNNAEAGKMIFIDKTNGKTSEKIFTLDEPMLEYAESILKKLEAVNAHVAAGTCPDAALIDDCKGCAFCKTACFPGADYGPGIDIMQDPELEAKLDRRGELEAAAKEYEALDKELKDGFKGKPGAVVGNWMIESSRRERKGVDLPPELKKQYETSTEYYVTKIGRI